jgi:ATP-dependent Clp protease, protease subunit
MPKDIYVYGLIGESFWEEGITDESIRKELDALERGDEHTVHINSMGGATHHGVAIFNLLSAHKKKQKALNPSYSLTTVVDGFAYSAASIIMLAGDKRVMNPGSRAMIHNAWMYAQGDYRDMQKAKEYLEKAVEGLGDLYSQVTGKKAEDIRGLMDAETYFLPDEAKDFGLATDVSKVEKDKSKADPYEKQYKELQALKSGDYLEVMFRRVKKEEKPQEKTFDNTRQRTLDRLQREVILDRMLLVK